MAASLTKRFGVYDHDVPTVFNCVEAYAFNVSTWKWVALNMADVAMNTAVISAAEFAERFPNLPPLPKGSFSVPLPETPA